MTSNRALNTKAVMYAPQVEKIPFLPGNNFHDDPVNRSTLRKSHGLGQAPNVGGFVPPTEYSQTNYPTGSPPVRSTRRQTAEEIQNTWAPKDEPYQFLGYFKEAVSESATETFRIRKVSITYYSNDKTVQIREAKGENSGMMNSVHGGGSVLVRRHVVYDVDGSPLELDDFSIGSDFECYGKVFRITDADQRTRNQLEARGMPVGEAEAWPADQDEHAKVNARRMIMDGSRKLKSEDMDVKRQAEFAVSGRYSKTHPETTRAAKQFLAASGNRHLTFSALWDDRDEAKGDCRKMTIKYFLEDDTFEICENRVVNSGREGGGRFLCRQRISKESKTGISLDNHASQHNTFGVMLRSGFLTHRDIAIGQKLSIHGKTILIYDADSFTRNWYATNFEPLGDAQPVEHILRRGEKEPPKHYPPPHDGFGDEQDSLGNWKNLMLRPVKRDAARGLLEGHKILRFRAKFHNPRAAEDVDREFVVNYYPVTEEFEIIENAVRNAGIISGTYLTKTKLYKPLNQQTGKRERITGDDLHEGAVLTFLGREFLLLEIDAKSQKYRDGVEDEPTVDNVKNLIVLFKDLLNQKYERLATAIRSISTSGYVTVSDIERFFQLHNQVISKREAKTLLAHFDKKGMGKIDFQSFVNIMEYNSTQSLDDCSNRPASIKIDHIVDAQEDATDIEDKASAERVLYRRVLTMLRDRLGQRRMRQQEIFRLMAGKQSDSKLDIADFKYGVKHILHMQLTEREENILNRSLFGNKEKVTYTEFSTFLEGVDSVACE
eukprot:TRINITY_DN15929_c0_g1_i1.p1 TRINITY_DN15929_c0_g1~~TRINITY_DN15929_c0_g1_i1.p1  ORF type:complete len:775 (+),score=127.01 TRINITY_DN15929_c0_g1_i1:45-2369(+)